MNPFFTFIMFFGGLAITVLLIGRICYEEGMDFD